jgi:hypothetical protein
MRNKTTVVSAGSGRRLDLPSGVRPISVLVVETDHLWGVNDFA